MTFDEWIVGEMDRGLGPDEVDQMRSAWICARYEPNTSFTEWVRDIVTINEHDDDNGSYRDLTNLEKDQMRAAWYASLENVK